MFIDCMLRALEVSWLHVTLIAIVFIIIYYYSTDTIMSMWTFVQQSKSQQAFLNRAGA